MKSIKLLYILLILHGFTAFGQHILTLNDCYKLLNKNYPIAAQKAMLTSQNKLDITSINNLRLPHLDLAAKATYQSDVTSVDVPLPGITVPMPNKDQYRATLTADQLIYNAGLISKQLAARNSLYKVKNSAINVKMHQLKYQINTLFFSILLTNQKTNLLQDKAKQLNQQLKELTQKVQHGIALASSKSLLDAEYLKINQQIYEAKTTKISFLKSLSILLGQKLPLTTILQNPTILIKTKPVLNRPELRFFELQKQQINKQSNLLNIENKPKLFAFVQGGYGNPGLNLFDHNFATFYIVGMQLNWNVFDWDITKKKKQSLEINKQIIDTQKKEFTLKTKLKLTEQTSQINSLKHLIQTDKKIIPLRTQVLQTASNQLKNGIITPSQYITQLTNLYESKINLKTHQIQLEWAKINYLTTTGNYENKN